MKLLISTFNLKYLNNNKENKIENGISSNILEKNCEKRENEIKSINHENDIDDSNNNKHHLNQHENIEILNISEMNSEIEMNNKENNIDKRKNAFSILRIENKRNNSEISGELTIEEMIKDTKLRLAQANIKKIMILISSIQSIKKIIKRLI